MYALDFLLTPDKEESEMEEKGKGLWLIGSLGT